MIYTQSRLVGVSTKEDNDENNNGDKEEDKNKTEQE